ncbi:ClbS/DfsB family four-helix bundle protein [Neptunitalea lumnitzerae]|uniref:ClbS/DfsB family four-helix bundle protein n=1 Tax=Neptunitalea lumnitzerae TaxID=2965509 RepID=A0ABQ5MJS9_9FLAO|nr:ClbS/DfsB family four-helix bundle protein [Neptunitalea sp. Y10]GLB49671.1 hypothetical protein Y10_20390 [Neptunitalea sp. Y10]
MPIPIDKISLVKQSEENYDKLLTLIHSIPTQKRNMEFTEGTMNRNIRDVIGHLYHWQLLFTNWYYTGMDNEKPAMPQKGYKWKQTKELNLQIWELYQTYTLEKVLNLLNESHQKMLSIIQSHTNEELFEKKKYNWTGSSSVATYIRANCSSHYNWAIKLIKKGLQEHLR